MHVSVREILPQLRSGKVTRGRVGVQVTDVKRQATDELGLKEKTGAVVSSVEEDGPAEKAGLQDGDVILSWNGQAVKSSDELVRMVVRTRPGSSVPLRVWRDKKERPMTITVAELDLDAENGRKRETTELSRLDTSANKGFGMTIENVSTDVSRRINTRGAVITDIDAGSPAEEDGLAVNDVIVKVGSTPVTTAAEAQRELGQVPAGGTALVHIVRPDRSTKGYKQYFLMVTKD